MSNHSTWSNAKVMANQGSAPKVKQMYDTIINDPFSCAFFLSSLYDAKEKQLMAEHPEYFINHTHESARLRVELILVEMYIHIKTIQRRGLQSMMAD